VKVHWAKVVKWGRRVEDIFALETVSFQKMTFEVLYNKFIKQKL
jgi:UTP:GlnB (protein PII) uridylyltransferase